MLVNTYYKSRTFCDVFTTYVLLAGMYGIFSSQKFVNGISMSHALKILMINVYMHVHILSLT